MRPGLAHAVAIGASFLAIVVVDAGWFMYLRTDPRLFTLTAELVVLTALLGQLALTVLWLIVRAIAGRWIVWRAGVVLPVTAVSAYVVTAVTCGPVACFQQGPNRAMGWFIVGGVALAALVHHFVLNRLQQDARNGRQ